MVPLTPPSFRVTAVWSRRRDSTNWYFFMVNRNLIRSLEDDDVLNELAIMAPDEEAEDWLLEAITEVQQDYAQGEIVDGRIVEVNDEWALIDVGFKSEGTVGLDEWGPEEEQPKVGDTVKVLIEEMEDELGAADDPYGMISLSKRKAEKIIEWEEMMETVAEGQVVTGTVIRKIKGGLLVDIGVNVFLPGSQVDIRRPGDIGDFIGRVIQAEVLKIDDTRRNIVISRRSLIENQREEDRAYLMKELEVGQVRKGIVKNIADFGAFVDLGGIDGLLHITDMAWERIGHPSEMVSIDQEIEVKVLHIDREKQKIALGLKQKDRNPWENIETKYPVDSSHKGEVVNVMSYGAFVKLEPGIEGLVHISEMCWTKRVNHPSELVNIGDEIDVKILGVDPEGQQLSLGMKQTQKNPVGRGPGALSRRCRRHGQGAQPDQLRCVHRVGRRHRRPAARQRHVVDAKDQPSQRNAGKRPGNRVPRVERRRRTSPHRAWAEAAG